MRTAKKLPLLLFISLLCCVLGACGAQNAAGVTPETESPAPPSPSPASTPMPTSLVLTDESAEDILSLAEIPTLTYIDATASREYAALAELRELLPDCRIDWVYELDGQLLPSDTEELVLTDPSGLEDALPYLPALKKVDLTGCEPSMEQMELCYDLRPDVDFLWTFSFGKWTVRSDLTCFSSLQPGSVDIYRYTSEDVYPLLRFCPHLRALDLGHNGLSDISLIGELDELQVLILADNPYLEDISPLANLKNLYYLELFLCPKITDFSSIYELTAMRDLNISYCRELKDISFIDNMPDLELAFFLGSYVDMDQVNAYRESRPDLTIKKFNPVPDTSVGFGWREKGRNVAIRWAFSHWRYVEEFVTWDNVIYTDEYYQYYPEFHPHE